MQPKARILYVDDEQINLINFSQALSEEYEIFTAGSGREGLQALADIGEMAVVVSDQRMPGMSGVDLLSKVRETSPDSVRIIITGYTEARDMLDSINRGHIYKYIVKPWDSDTLRITLKNAVERYRLTKQNKELMADLVAMNAELESRVEERTRELNEANSALKRINEQLAGANQQVQAQSAKVGQLNGVLNEKVNELEKALGDVKILQGLLPICSFCKKIRDDRNYWQELETYMGRHADISFTHSICPDCYDHYLKADLDALREDKELRQRAGKEPGSS